MMNGMEYTEGMRVRQHQKQAVVRSVMNILRRMVCMSAVIYFSMFEPQS